MGMIKDFFRSMSEQRSYPYYYRLRANQRAQRRTVTFAATMAVVMVIGFFVVTSLQSNNAEKQAALDAVPAVTESIPASQENTPLPPIEATPSSLPKLLDCLTCPEISLIESSDPGEMQRLGISRAPVTYMQYMEFAEATGHRPPGCIPKGGHSSVRCISWDDTQAYIGWLTLKTNKIYRLPNEAEWKKASAALNTKEQDLPEQWLDGCGDATDGQETDAPCQLRLIEKGTETPHAEVPETQNDGIGFRLVRKLSRVSIY